MKTKTMQNRKMTINFKEVFRRSKTLYEGTCGSCEYLRSHSSGVAAVWKENEGNKLPRICDSPWAHQSLKDFEVITLAGTTETERPA